MRHSTSNNSTKCNKIPVLLNVTKCPPRHDDPQGGDGGPVELALRNMTSAGYSPVLVYAASDAAVIAPSPAAAPPTFVWGDAVAADLHGDVQDAWRDLFSAIELAAAAIVVALLVHASKCTLLHRLHGAGMGGGGVSIMHCMPCDIFVFLPAVCL